MARFASVVLGAVLTLSSARLASAQESAAADVLFKEAKSLMAEGKVSQACPKFQAALDLQRTLGTLMNLADCLEQEGKTASAHTRWNEAVQLATEQKDDRLSFAQERKNAVAPRVPKLFLDVVGGREALVVSVRGNVVPATKYGLPLDTDPGTVVVEVSRGETVLEKREAALTEGQTTRLALDLDAISKAHPAAEKGATKAGPEPRPEQRVAGFVVLGVGLAGVTAFAVLESVALAKRSEADEAGNCVEKNDKALCSPQGYELVEDAGTLAEVGQWVGLGGLAVVGVGITLVLTAPLGDPDEEEPKTAVVPWVTPTGGGLVVGGVW
jgi:hypothetical protein